MKKIFLIYIFSFIIQFGFTQHYQLDINASKLEWSGKAAYSAYTLSGTLTVATGELFVKDGLLKKAKIIIDMNSLDTEIGELEQHLRSEDFFEVNNYPEATFILTQPVKLNKGSMILTGKMQIKEEVHTENIHLSAKKVGNNWVFSGEVGLDRTKYGIYYNSPSFFKSLKQNAIADEFELDITVVFNRGD